MKPGCPASCKEATVSGFRGLQGKCIQKIRRVDLSPDISFSASRRLPFSVQFKSSSDLVAPRHRTSKHELVVFPNDGEIVVFSSILYRSTPEVQMYPFEKHHSPVLLLLHAFAGVAGKSSFDYGLFQFGPQPICL